MCLLTVLTSVAAAQVSEFEGRQIVDIRFSPASPLDPADLDRVQPLRKGEPLRGQDVADAIDGLFATGCFEDIVVEAEPSGDGVIILFVTQNTWFVGGVALEGKVTPPPNRPQIAGAGQFTLGVPFQDEDLKQASDAMKRLLEANGLYQAEVTPTVERSSKAEQVFLTFKIRGNKRAKYEKPLIQGETKLPENTILRATGWRLPIVHWWKRVTDARTRNGVQGVLQKYAKEDRLAARVEVQKLDYDAERRRVRPTLSINAGPKVEVKALEAKVSKRVLKRYVPVFEEGTIDNDLLVEGRRNLSDYFQSRGYFDVQVEFRVQPLQNDTQTVEYVIAQGPRQNLAHVAIVGNRYFDTDDIRERMFIQPGSFPLRRGRYSGAFQRKDEDNIVNLYRSNGFRDVKVGFLVDRNYQGKAGDIAVTVNIEEGPQWIVDNLRLDGITADTRDELVAMLASSAGQPFADASLATDRNQVLAYYYSRGFPDAKFKATWEANDTPNHVNLAYTITEGAPQYVREILISGLRTTRQSVVSKRITLQPGEPLSPMEQAETQKRLYDLGIFARIDTAIQNPEGGTRHKYILYNFEEANRYNVGVGLGAQIARFGSPSKNSVSAPAGSTGFSPSISLNVNRINFLGIGHTVTLQGSYSSLEKGGSLSYLDPRFRSREGRSLTLTLTYDNSLNVSTFASKRQEASVQLSQRFSKSTSGLFRFAYRRVSVGSVVIPVLLVPLLLQPVRIGMLSGNLLRDRRDDAAEPRSGTYNSVDIGVAGRFFGSQRSFGRILLRNATYHRLTKSTVLARQTQFGVIAPFAAPSGISARGSVPLPERFFGGGAESLRAFPFNQAGPRDTGAALVGGGEPSQPTGFPLGGNALLFNNVELRFPLIGQNVQGVLFHDVGNVFSTLSKMSFRFRQRDLQDFDYAAHAVGFGVRYRTPIGPIRVDLAYSVNPPSFLGFKGSPAELLQCNPNQTMLPGFCQAGKQNVSHFQFFFSIGQTF